MKTTDLFRTSSRKLNESLAKTFGRKIDFESFDNAKLEDARNKLRTQVSQIRSEAGFNENIENDAYHEAQWMLDAINAELAEREELLATGGTAEVSTDEGFDPEEFEGEIEDVDVVGDDGEEDTAVVTYKAKVVDGKPVVEKESIEVHAAGRNPSSKLGYDVEGDTMMQDLDELLQMCQQDADEQWAERDQDTPEEGIGDVLDKVGAAAHKLMKGDKQEKPAVVTAPAKRPTKHKETPLMPPEHKDEDSHNNMGFSDKEIKMAYGVLNDPRLKGGNLTKAAEIIEKIAPGLSKHPGVQRAMKATSESIKGEEMSNITEGEIQQASAIVTAKTMVDRVGRWIEELSGMENDTLLQLGDSIRDEIGEQQSKAFIEAAAPSIQQALETLKGTRDSLSQAVQTLATGEAPADMLGAEPEGDLEGPAEPDAMNDQAGDMDMGDEFAAAEPAAGGIEAAGREKRESIDYQARLLKVLAG